MRNLNAKDFIDQLERTLAVYPIQINEFNNSLASAEARMEVARINPERTRAVAPLRCASDVGCTGDISE